MIKTLLVGAVLGFIGKKLYDKGSLDPFIERASGTVDSLAESAGLGRSLRKAKAGSTGPVS